MERVRALSFPLIARGRTDAEVVPGGSALKHRYAHPLPPSFDPRAIAARKPDVDWRGMLAEAVTAWGTVAAREAREVWAARRGSGAGEQGAAGTGEGR